MAFGLLAGQRDHAARQEDRDVQARMKALMKSGQVESGIAVFIEYWNQTPWPKIPLAVREQLIARASQISAEAAAVSMDTTNSYPISAPVHLIYGETSPSPAQRIVARLAETLVSASVEKIPNAGHMSLLRNPEKYISGILRLVRQRSQSK